MSSIRTYNNSSTMVNNENKICLRHGHQCSCSQCKIWLDHWERELESFAVVDRMMRQGEPLFHIYERLRAEFPTTLRLHYQSIEQQYIDFKQRVAPLPTPLPPRKRFNTPPQPSSPLVNLGDSDDDDIK